MKSTRPSNYVLVIMAIVIAMILAGCGTYKLDQAVLLERCDKSGYWGYYPATSQYASWDANGDNITSGMDTPSNLAFLQAKLLAEKEDDACVWVRVSNPSEKLPESVKARMSRWIEKNWK